jgi:hypothetical protein
LEEKVGKGGLLSKIVSTYLRFLIVLLPQASVFALPGHVEDGEVYFVL